MNREEKKKMSKNTNLLLNQYRNNSWGQIIAISFEHTFQISKPIKNTSHHTVCNLVFKTNFNTLFSEENT